MKRYPLACACLLTVSCSGPAQEARVVEPAPPSVVEPAGPQPEVSVAITPGLGTERLQIGQTQSQVESVLGTAGTRVDYMTEKQAWEAFGYDTRVALPFSIGFDHYLEYTPQTALSNIPAWKVFFKDGTLSYIILSSYSYTGHMPVTPGVSSPWLFGGSIAEMEAAFGTDHAYHVDEAGNQEYFYLERGVMVIVEAGQVRVVNVFAPFTSEQAESFLSRLGSVSRGPDR